MNPKIKLVKLACYSTSLTMSAVCNLSPVLFITFRSLYGISYSLLGLLVLINFVTQLIVDVAASFFSHKINIPKTVKNIPVIAAFGMLVYAVCPWLFPNQVYLWLSVGTVIFSAAAGLGEVFISPVIAALPSKDPDREMSKLHSVYAWGVVGVIVVSTCVLALAGKENWQWLALLFVTLPIISAFLFFNADMPDIPKPEKLSGAVKLLKQKAVWMCIIAIFLGGAAECTMAQWSSGYLEQAMGIDKVWGDLFGVALFSVMLGLGRSLYAKFGTNISKVLTLSAIGATVCYFIAAVTDIAIIGLLACAFTGLCTAMLWPGNLVVAAHRFPKGGVVIYALMAAGGDLGASVGPQLTGLITDAVIANDGLQSVAQRLSLSPQQLGMKMGMLAGMLFPLVGIFLYRRFWKTETKNRL